MEPGKLEKARMYEMKQEKNISPDQRPAFHLSPRTGWLNDPNGFSFYKGQYHLFYQYHPYSIKWGPMHWGHAVSKDLLKWEYLPCALAPDQEYDKGGCFSGSAVTMDDGRQLLMYTGCTEDVFDPNADLHQVQCIAVGDGLNYTKYEGNPVLDVTDLPDQSHPADFRDPKVWRNADGSYAAVVSSMDVNHSGQLILFKSPDGFDWSFDKVLLVNNRRFGLMWECPDFFEMDGKKVILVSAMDMLPEGFEYHNGNSNLCLIGSYDPEDKEFNIESSQVIDGGIDFYACQTLQIADGRRIMIGWMQNPDSSNYTVGEMPWYGQMSIPREIFLKDGRLWQVPLRELADHRCNPVTYTGQRIKGEQSLEGIHGRRVDMELRIRPADPENVYRNFIIRFAKNDQFWSGLSFRPDEKILRVDRKFSGSRRAIIHQRRCEIKTYEDELQLRIILDSNSIEVFINGGEQAMTAAIYTPQEADQISFFTDGEVEMDIVKYELR